MNIPINRRTVLKSMSAGAATLPLSAGLSGCAGASNRPNIILFMTDDQSYGDIGIHGNEHIRTPHLDRFAAEGVEFSRFYVSPVCAPTRASLMTGRYYYRTGVVHTSRGGAKMYGGEVTIAEKLRDAGYATGLFGKWHLGDTYPMRPQDQGFTETLWHKSGGIGQTPDKPNSYFDPYLWRNGGKINTSGYCTDVFTDAAIRFIEKNRDAPFFAYIPTNAPHGPLEISAEYVRPFLDMGLNEQTARVYGMIANIDENIGRLTATLDTLGLRDNTLFIFLTDNGGAGRRYAAGLRAGKSSTYEGGIRVPCFLQWPARLTGGRTIDRIAAHIDLHPTLLEAAGVEKSDDAPALDGVSLLSLLDGDETDWPDRTLYFQCHRGLTPQRYQNCATVTQQYKMVGFPETFSDENLDTSGNPKLELYDIDADPGEERDLAGMQPEILADLRRRYDVWFDDVRATRNFLPGRIHIGSNEENPLHLCRYQDSHYIGGKPTVWDVVVEQSGDYEVTVNRGSETGAGTLFLRIDGALFTKPLQDGEHTGTFTLPAGSAQLDVWTQELGADRTIHTDNSTLGDVDIRRL